MTLNVRAGRVRLGLRASGNGGKRSTEVRRVGRFPRLQMEVEPRPRAGEIAVLELQRPQVVERRAGVVADLAALRIARGDDHRAENSLGAARLARLRKAASLIRIERLDLFPQLDALDDILDELALGRRCFGLLERGAQGRPSERVRQRGLAGDA